MIFKTYLHRNRKNRECHVLLDSVTGTFDNASGRFWIGTKKPLYVPKLFTLTAPPLSAHASVQLRGRKYENVLLKRNNTQIISSLWPSQKIIAIFRYGSLPAVAGWFGIVLNNQKAHLRLLHCLR